MKYLSLLYFLQGKTDILLGLYASWKITIKLLLKRLEQLAKYSSLLRIRQSVQLLWLIIVYRISIWKISPNRDLTSKILNISLISHDLNYPVEIWKQFFIFCCWKSGSKQGRTQCNFFPWKTSQTWTTCSFQHS